MHAECSCSWCIEQHLVLFYLCSFGDRNPRVPFASNALKIWEVRNFPLDFVGQVRNFPHAEFSPAEKSPYRIPPPLRPKIFSCAETFQGAVVKEEGQPPSPLRPPPPRVQPPPSSTPMCACPPPPPLPFYCAVLQVRHPPPPACVAFPPDPPPLLQGRMTLTAPEPTGVFNLRPQQCPTWCGRMGPAVSAAREGSDL